MADLKAYATRRLNQTHGSARRWSRGGNAARLSQDGAINEAIRYIAYGQGAPMAVYAETRESMEMHAGVVMSPG